MSRVNVIVELKIQPGKVEEFIEAVQADLIAPTLEEEGCIRYELWQHNEDPAAFTLVEEWESQQTLDAHLAADHVHAASARLPEFVSEPAREERYTPLV